MRQSKQKWFSTLKTYGHDTGLCATFRQWRAPSHCRLFHGYAISVSVEFITDTLDDRGWVVDYGDMSSFKNALKDQFDHVTLVAVDDPEKEQFMALHERGIMNVKIMPKVGCEAFATYIFCLAQEWLEDYKKNELARLIAISEPTPLQRSLLNYPRKIYVTEVQVKEHGANTAIVRQPVVE